MGEQRMISFNVPPIVGKEMEYIEEDDPFT